MSETLSERIEYTVLGRVVGTATGWDLVDTFVMQLYDFEPSNGVDLPKAEFMSFDFENGVAQVFNDDGTVVSKSDIVKALYPLPTSIQATA